MNRWSGIRFERSLRDFYLSVLARGKSAFVTLVRIVLRADSGFCSWNMLRRCEPQGVGYIVGLAKNSRLLALVKRGHCKAGVGRQRFELSEIMKAYDTFGNAAKERALKMVSRPRAQAEEP